MFGANQISIVRERAVVNIPGFDDDSTGNPQNEWVKLYDFKCVGIYRAESSKVYSFGNAPRSQTNYTTDWKEFVFNSALQEVKPPYDIQEGDYIMYRQNGERKTYRIQKIEPNFILPNCCTPQIIAIHVGPRDSGKELTCGPTLPISNEEIISCSQLEEEEIEEEVVEENDNGNA